MDKSNIEPGDILRGTFVQHVHKQVQSEQFDYVMTGQLHADGKNIEFTFVVNKTNVRLFMEVCKNSRIAHLVLCLYIWLSMNYPYLNDSNRRIQCSLLSGAPLLMSIVSYYRSFTEKLLINYYHLRKACLLTVRMTNGMC